MMDIQVVKRDTIPPIAAVEEGGEMHHLGELRDFSWSQELRSFMGSGSGFSASWVQLAHGEVLEPHAHPVLSMMVFYGGSGELLGDLAQPLEGDEVVVVPPGCLHGFVGGPPGLFALSIQFARGLYSAPDKPRVIFSDEDQSPAGLLALSEQRAKAFTGKPMFELFSDGTLANLAQKEAFLGAFRVWINGIEPLLLSRQASCGEPEYQLAFRQHLCDFLQAEHGRRKGRLPVAARDPALEALTNWFAYQMYVLDNAEKTAIVHLVVEKVNAVCRQYLLQLLGGSSTDEYLGAQTRRMESGVALGLNLLRHETPATYARLKEFIDEAWDMAEAMTDRVEELTRRSGRP